MPSGGNGSLSAVAATTAWAAAIDPMRKVAAIQGIVSGSGSPTPRAAGAAPPAAGRAR